MLLFCPSHMPVDIQLPGFNAQLALSFPQRTDQKAAKRRAVSVYRTALLWLLSQNCKYGISVNTALFPPINRTGSQLNLGVVAAVVLLRLLVLQTTIIGISIHSSIMLIISYYNY